MTLVLVLFTFLKGGNQGTAGLNGKLKVIRLLRSRRPKPL